MLVITSVIQAVGLSVFNHKEKWLCIKSAPFPVNFSRHIEGI